MAENKPRPRRAQKVRQSSEPSREREIARSSRAAKSPEEGGVRRRTSASATLGRSTARSDGAPSAAHAKRTISQWRRWGVAAVAVVMLLGTLTGLLFFARPTVSEFENRTLTQYPELTLERFLNGSFFTDWSLWYADTYPAREPLVRANLDMKKVYGIQPDVQLVGGNRTSDQLPPEGERTTATQHERPHDVDAPEARMRAAEMEDQITDGVYVDTKKGACYTLYYFDQDATQAYVDVINDAADLLKGKASVYSVLLPTNAGIMLDDDTLAKLGVPNQKQAIDYFYSLMNDNVVTVDTYDVLFDHSDEYLYFRTDHHWTQLAAYYVYTSFCAQKGIEPAPYDEWEELAFSPFMGEYAAAADNGFEPDTVYARIPQGTNEMEYWVDDLDDSSRTAGPVITDLTDADPDSNKYNCFVCGNRPLSHIHNPAVTDGSSCLVVKDSFGNPFVSVMVDNYEDIYTIDFRFTSQKLLDMVEKYDIQDVVFENVIMFAGTYNCSDMLSYIVYPDDSQDAAASNDEGDNANAS